MALKYLDQYHWLIHDSGQDHQENGSYLFKSWISSLVSSTLWKKYKAATVFVSQIRQSRKIFQLSNAQMLNHCSQAILLEM